MAESTFRWPWPAHYGDWTEADLASAPDDSKQYEVLHGRLIVSTAQPEEQQGVSGATFVLLRNAAPAGWRVRYGIGVRLANGNVLPDLAVLRPDAPRDQVWIDAKHVGLVVEVASRSIRRYDGGEKAVAYAESGISCFWQVVPGAAGGVHVHLLAGVGEYTHQATVAAGETLTVTEPFEITIRADELLTPTR